MKTYFRKIRRLFGDVNAIRKGTIIPRILNRLLRMLGGKLIKKISKSLLKFLK